MQHRFYGDSISFENSKEEVMNNATLRGYFSWAQAIADYAQVLLQIKQKFSAPNSPIIVIGVSYGGRKLKYPHTALAALASSAPILYFDNIIPQDAYDSIVSKSFKDL
ncbi:hypothetical protein M9H77_16326 [Catharanthus roseus]|uniref:Uncharacterized protein n=1 Tax=Catharanthus roseus TaxID=4058 RepID=A0ACC0B1L1_CATRO|nr:hypothetical protein M9H77_16326 [Catharanthus roseus]